MERILQACTCFGLKSTYHDRFNASATLRSKFDDEKETRDYLRKLYWISRERYVFRYYGTCYRNTAASKPIQQGLIKINSHANCRNYSETKSLSLLFILSLSLPLSFFLAHTGNIFPLLLVHLFFFILFFLARNYRITSETIFVEKIYYSVRRRRKRGLYNIYNILSLYNYTQTHTTFFHYEVLRTNVNY